MQTLNKKTILHKLTIYLVLIILLTSTTYASGTYHGNIKSHKFHKSSCRYYKCKNCVKVFSTRVKAVKAGYKPCKICKP